MVSLRDKLIFFSCNVSLLHEPLSFRKYEFITEYVLLQEYRFIFIEIVLNILSVVAKLIIEYRFIENCERHSFQKEILLKGVGAKCQHAANAF